MEAPIASLVVAVAALAVLLTVIILVVKLVLLPLKLVTLLLKPFIGLHLVVIIAVGCMPLFLVAVPLAALACVGLAALKLLGVRARQGARTGNVPTSARNPCVVSAVRR